MVHASPNARKYGSPLQSPPGRRPLSDYLSDDRNSELSHREALDQARIEHERIRLNAIRIGELHELKEQQRRIEEEQKRIAELRRKEEDRLRAETAVREEQERLRKLQAQKVPELPPQPEPAKAPQQQQAQSKQPPQQQVKEGTAAVNGLTGQTTAKQDSRSSTATSPFAPATGPSTTAKTPSLFAAAAQPPPQKPFAPAQPSNGVQPSTASKQPAAATVVAKPETQAGQPPPTTLPQSDRYVQIHQELKKVRKELDRQSKIPGSPLKGKLGDMRRQVRKAMGQLTAGKGANSQPINTISTTLRQSLDGSVPSDAIDASLFVADKREPAEGAVHNGDKLPAAFIYLLNHLSKAIIHQFTSEVGANPKSAEPIGIVTAHIFSNKDFHWRGKPMIDILLAKFRIVCPVLFGARGDDKTTAGRAAVGWKKEDGHWISDQAHADRMTGLGAGFAAIALRDFSRASKPNPYPPTNYWKAMASIVNSPPQLISSTQFTVLKAMIDGHEERFILFYGNAAIAALRAALVEFPKKAPADSHTALGLQVLGQVLQKDRGLVLG
ncbi:hypothetical protein ACRALDRAFT_2097013 [Sodiomyces alcalophilus JCM 7366]|uniref:uncharacterized protein n=1 Tax=Sodiomyces alcalophilus JCM 7366 TaxID=591952 RepID=UPI0039B5D0F5